MGDYYLVINKKEDSGLDPLHQLKFINKTDLKKHENTKGTLIPQEINPENTFSIGVKEEKMWGNENTNLLNNDVLIDIKPEKKNLIDLPLKKILTNMSQTLLDTYAETIVTLHRDIPNQTKYNIITTFLQKDDRLIYIGIFFVLISISFSFLTLL